MKLNIKLNLFFLLICVLSPIPVIADINNTNLQDPGGPSSAFGLTESAMSCKTPEICTSNDIFDNPVNVPWNGFLDQVNIVSIQNRCAFAEQVLIEVINSSGTVVSASSRNLSSKSQVDLIVNEMLGFSTSAVGYLRITSTTTGCIDGSLNRYRGGVPDIDFVLNIPFGKAVRGSSYAFFNTAVLSSNFFEQLADQTTNWIEIINLASSSKTFIKNLYGADGLLIETESIIIPAGGRVDVRAAASLIGSNSASGTVEIVPIDSTSRYQARVFRYSGTAVPTGPRQFGLEFAASVETSKAFTDCRVIQVSRGAQGNNNILISNTSNASSDVVVSIKNGSIEQAEGFPQVLSIPAKSLRGLSATSALLARIPSGIMEVCGDGINPIVAASITQFGLSRPGARRTVAGYSKPIGLASCGGQVISNYNTFLGQQNWLRLSSTCETELVEVMVRVFGPQGNELVAAPLTINPGRVEEISLQNEPFNLAPNTYGLVQVDSDSSNPGGITASVVRVRSLGPGQVDFATCSSAR